MTSQPSHAPPVPARVIYGKDIDVVRAAQEAGVSGIPSGGAPVGKEWAVYVLRGMEVVFFYTSPQYRPVREMATETAHSMGIEHERVGVRPVCGLITRNEHIGCMSRQ